MEMVLFWNQCTSEISVYSPIPVEQSSNSESDSYESSGSTGIMFSIKQPISDDTLTVSRNY